MQIDKVLILKRSRIFLEKLKNKLICVFVILSIIALGVALLLIPNKNNKNTTYNIDATVSENKLKGELNLEYINNNNFDINELYFCLYPNAFKNEENIQNTTVSDRVNEAYPDGFNKGQIDIIEVLFNDKKIDFTLEKNEQILKIITPLIKKENSADIKIVFNEILPESPSRFGFGENTYNFGNWYPVLCPFIDGKPYKCIYTSIGDPFFSECADYNVTLTLAPEFRIGTSGQILKKEIVDPTKTKWSLKGENIRDFAFIISDKYNVLTKQAGNTFIYSYYLNDDEIGKKTIEIAENALRIFNNIFGEYPYSSLCIAESDFYIGGMEYPNLVFINTDLYNTSAIEALEEVIVHEIAHQWWYGVVGNNEIEEAWLDEGLTQYSVALYYENLYGKERYKSFLQEGEIYSKVVFDILNDSDINFTKNIERKTTEFEHWILYDALTYDVSALMLDEVRDKIGDENFFESIRNYYENNKYKNATKNDFINSMSSSCQKNIEGIIRPWLEGKIYWG